jgi:hypothetical protein
VFEDHKRVLTESEELTIQVEQKVKEMKQKRLSKHDSLRVKAIQDLIINWQQEVKDLTEKNSELMAEISAVDVPGQVLLTVQRKDQPFSREDLLTKSQISD